jgi:maleate cis-trans isomerase
MGKATSQLLGIIEPSSRSDGERRLESFGESHEYGSWLSAHGVDNVEVRFDASVSDGSHGFDAVWETANPKHLLPAARRLGEAGVDAVAWACTCGSFIGGVAWSRDQVRMLGEAAGKPATSTSVAILAAIEALDIGSADVISPYPQAVTDAFVEFLRENGTKIVTWKALDCVDDSVSMRLDVVEEVEKLLAAGAGNGDAIIVPDTAVQSFPVIQRIEAMTKKPIVTANQATLWHSMILLGRRPRIPDGGRLFEQ